ncbi:MAG: ABC transporter substrate-binding protein [Chloroflexi bacterium]|nr:ABC transporter substrate-binding protein [Chloroflexota bacterium]
MTTTGSRSGGRHISRRTALALALGGLLVGCTQPGGAGQSSTPSAANAPTAGAGQPSTPAPATSASSQSGGQAAAPGAPTPVVKAPAAGATTAPATGATPATGPLKTLKVAAVYAYLGYLPMYAAMQRGFLRDQGLAFEVLEFKGGGDAAKAFVGGASDILIGSYDHILKLREQGLDVVATGNVEAMYAYALMAKKGSPYTSVESLKGKKIGTTGPGSSTDINVRYALKQAGIDPDREAELISVGGGGPMLAALDNDQIAAGMFLDPLLTQLLGQPDRYQIAHDFRNLEYPLLCVTMRRDWLKSNGDPARRLLKALVHAEAELQRSPDVAVQIARDKFGDIDPSVLEAATRNTLPRLSKDGKISETAHKNVLDQQVFAGGIKTQIPYAQAVDLSYLPS